ncbi:MAG: hypothetical protein GY863_22765 [bacterium]|nr:hypothetical protein [bacterium]
MKNRTSVLLSLVLLLSINCNIGVNRTIYIDDGEEVRGSQNTVNGSIIIGSDCVVGGSCRSVNGDIEVGENSNVRSLQAVNGRIRLERDVTVMGDVEAINLRISCYPGVKIDGEVYSVNGKIDMDNTTVSKNVSTYNGDIILTDRSRVKGDLVIRRNRGDYDHRRRLTIEIDDSVVEGDIIVRDRDIEVTVYLMNGGKVEGKIEGAEVVKR